MNGMFGAAEDDPEPDTYGDQNECYSKSFIGKDKETNLEAFAVYTEKMGTLDRVIGISNIVILVCIIIFLIQTYLRKLHLTKFVWICLL